jgi:integrase
MKTEQKAEWKNGWKPTGTNGVLARESVVGDETITTFYIRARREGKAFFEKIGIEGRIYPDYAGYREKKVRGIDQGTLDEALAGCVRSAFIRGEIEPASKRREKEREAKANTWTFDALWTAMKKDPDRGHKVNDDGSIDLTVGWRGTKKADEKYRKHVAPRFGNREPKDIRVNDIESWRADLAKKYTKATTISLISILKSIANYGASLEICPGIAFPVKLKGKKLGRAAKTKHAPTQEERDRFIKTCQGWPTRQEANFMLLVAFTGMRRGSARNLKWEDINLDRKTATLVDSKTGDVEIQIDHNTVDLLKNHPREMVSPYVFTGRGWEPLLTKAGEPVLHKKNGRMRAMQIERDLLQLTQRQIDRVPAMIRDAAELRRELDPCHCFRRGHANRAHKAGLSVKGGMASGGWRSPQMYLHYLTTTEEEVAAGLSETADTIPDTKSQA